MKATEFIVRVNGHEGRGSTPERAIERLPKQARESIPESNPVFGDGDTELNIERVYHA